MKKLIGMVVVAMKCRPLFATLVFFCFPHLSQAQVAVSFDDVPTGLLSSQYSAQGATFNSPMVRDYSQTPGFSHSGNQAIELCFAIEFCKSQLNVHFTAGQRRVKIFTGFTSQLTQPSLVRLRALDQNGNLVAESTAILGPSASPIPVQVPIEVTSQAPRIRQIIVGFASSDAFSNGLVFDDLEFSTAGPPPACTTQQNPTVALTQPQLSPTVQINEFMLQGTVQTAAPLDLATLTVIAPGYTRTTDVLGTIIQPMGGPFGAIRVDEALSSGINTVTVTARNCHGTSQASATVTYAPVPNGTVLKLLGIEITQATQDINNSVRLIAGKPTVVRLYFSTTGSPASISGVRADITGYREGANFPLLAQSIGPADIDASQDVGAKRLDLTKSLNFNLSPDFFVQGLIHFWLINLHIEGPGGATLACDGCVNWQARFQPSRPLNLVVAPFHYQKSNLTADAGVSLMGGLTWVNNVFPLSGNFPIDPAGINLMMILPTQSTALILARDNDRFIWDLQTTLSDLLAQGFPSDTHLFGIIPSGTGGYAEIPGHVGFGDSRAIESPTFPLSDPESYGQLWAQEIAHNFGRLHASTSHGEMSADPNFPYAHGGIGEPGLAISTEGWNGSPFLLNPGVPNTGSKHAHDFMSYGANSPDNINSWVSPYTYKGLMNSFQVQALAAVPSIPSEKLVVSANIDKDGAALLRPFHIVTTGFSTGSGVAGDLNVTLVGAKDQTLLTYHFDARRLANSSSLSFNEFVPWKAGTERIVLKRNQTVLAERRVSAHKPWVRVTSPRGGEIWGPKTTVSWEAGDDDNDPLTYTVLYNSGHDERWVPIATNVADLSATIDTALLVGSRNARIRVRATDGVNTTEENSGTFTLPENPPVVMILGTVNGQAVPRENAVFTGSAYDPKDGILPAAKLHWSSDRYGSLGTGRQIRLTRPLSPGSHAITLTATNSQGRTARTVVNIIVR